MVVFRGVQQQLDKMNRREQQEIQARINEQAKAFEEQMDKMRAQQQARNYQAANKMQQVKLS